MPLIDVLGQPAVRLDAADGAQATVLLHGGHVVSWRPAGGGEQLYLSPLAQAGTGRAVRGGIPVIFPQFERRGPLPRHGFARDRAWTLAQSERRPDHAFAVLRLTDDAETRAIWPHAFEAELTVGVGGRGLEIELAVVNTGPAELSFTAALHTYLRCEDVRRTRVTGLLGRVYEDSRDGSPHRHDIEPLTFVGEIDRIYWDADTPVLVDDVGRRLELTTSGFADRVVWNPGPEKAAALADLPDDDWLRMLCLEAAVIGRPATLPPGEEWVARQTLLAA